MLLSGLDTCQREGARLWTIGLLDISILVSQLYIDILRKLQLFREIRKRYRRWPISIIQVFFSGTFKIKCPKR